MSFDLDLYATAFCEFDRIANKVQKDLLNVISVRSHPVHWGPKKAPAQRGLVPFCRPALSVKDLLDKLTHVEAAHPDGHLAAFKPRDIEDRVHVFHQLATRDFHVVLIL